MRGAVLLLLILVPLTARAADTLVSGSYARECADQADLSASGVAASGDAVATCAKAITDEALSSADLSATHVNRGVLYLPTAPAAAERDFRAAIVLTPTQGDAYVDLGAAEIAQGRFDAGIADIDKALGMALKQPAKAYFNRAVAEDDKNQETAAYLDFRTALQLRPAWPLAIAELARFTVTTR